MVESSLGLPRLVSRHMVKAEVNKKQAELKLKIFKIQSKAFYFGMRYLARQCFSDYDYA